MRLNYYNLYNVNGVKFYLYEGVDIMASDVIDYTINENDRLDLLSYKLYGDSAAWFILALANNLFLPFCQVRVGDNIRVPVGNFNNVLFKR